MFLGGIGKCIRLKSSGFSPAPCGSPVITRRKFDILSAILIKIRLLDRNSFINLSVSSSILIDANFYRRPSIHTQSYGFAIEKYCNVQLLLLKTLSSITFNMLDAIGCNSLFSKARLRIMKNVPSFNESNNAGDDGCFARMRMMTL